MPGRARFVRRDANPPGVADPESLHDLAMGVERPDRESGTSPSIRSHRPPNKLDSPTGASAVFARLSRSRERRAVRLLWWTPAFADAGSA